jgi:hypothetical protein
VPALLVAAFSLAGCKRRGLAPLLLSAVVALTIAVAIGFSHNEGWSVPGLLEAVLWLGIWALTYALFIALSALAVPPAAAGAGATADADAATGPASDDAATKAAPDAKSNTDGNPPPVAPANTDGNPPPVAPHDAAPPVAPHAAEPPRTATGRFSAQRILVRFAVIFLCWLPTLIAVYPGILFNDTIIQLAQWFGEPMYGYSSITADASYSDHHPVFLMLVYGLIVQAGWSLFGDANAGLFTLVVIESLLSAATYGFALNYLERIQAPRMLVRVLFICWCAFPLFAWFCAIPVKETAFSWLYLLFCICVYEFSRSLQTSGRPQATSGPPELRTRSRPYRPFRTWRWRLSFVAICLLLALTKKTGVYLVVLVCLLLIILYREQIRLFLVAAALPALTIFLVLPRLFFPAFNISAGTPVEMLGIFYQQTARYVLDNPDDVSDDERQVIDELFGFETIGERYNPRNIDPLKGFGFLQGVEAWPNSEQVGRYLKVYLAQGLRHPDAYLRALGALWSPWFYPQSYAQAGVFYLSENWIEHAAWPPDTVPNYHRPEALTAVTSVFITIQFFVAALPPLIPLYVPAFYLLLLPAFCWSLLLESRRRAVKRVVEANGAQGRHRPPGADNHPRSRGFGADGRPHLRPRGYCALMVPVLVSLALLLLSPKTGIDVESMRYAIPFINSAPLLLGLSLTTARGDVRT